MFTSSESQRREETRGTERVFKEILGENKFSKWHEYTFRKLSEPPRVTETNPYWNMSKLKLYQLN
jgi:hypothetical protein